MRTVATVHERAQKCGVGDENGVLGVCSPSTSLSSSASVATSVQPWPFLCSSRERKVVQEKWAEHAWALWGSPVLKEKLQCMVLVV
jgi:hypothetical protein